MCVRNVAARILLATTASGIIGAAPASAQRLDSPTSVVWDDKPLVMIVGDGPPAARRSSARWPSLARHLTSQEQAALVTRAFPKGLPPVRTAVDPTGLARQVVLGPERMYDADHTAVLMLFRASYSPPTGLGGGPGSIAANAGAGFTIWYRPTKAGAPVMIQCQLEPWMQSSRLEIAPYDQSATVVSHVDVPKPMTLTFLVLPTSIGPKVVHIVVKNGEVQLHACAVTPLS